MGNCNFINLMETLRDVNIKVTDKNKTVFYGKFKPYKTLYEKAQNMWIYKKVAKIQVIIYNSNETIIEIILK